MERPSWPANLPSSCKHAVEELLRGQESAKKLRDLFNALSRAGAGDHDGARHPVSAEDLVVNVLQSFDNTLSLLSRAEPDPDKFSPVPVKACVKSEDSEESSKTSVPRDRRGCYKRRKTSDTQTRLDHNLIDDGHQWRKYGQKAILNSEFPRNYFRCTHKIDQGCQATKQVQKIKDDPTVYRTIYQGHHTCESLILKSPPLILDSPSPGDSSILVSFNTSLTSKQDNNHPFSSSTFSSVKHEQKLLGDDDLTPRHGCHDGNSNSNNNRSTSSNYYAVFESAGEISALSSDQGDVMSSSHSFDLIVESDFDDLLDIVEC
ncbi:probable WRKY transcription factor 70 [Syzygium oleosum]|uniref:probable WRKY transcription factor 70 n=1 Tax=Syzygium oleosum TaxID=219896 RepID=UPI0011D183FE|nr:probable WRKY transcription factor 70 [Syzygium oleosum]